MSDSFDKAQLMAYVHGEMSDAEARAFTEALSQDENLRLEVEGLLEASQTLTAYFAAGTNEGLDPKQLARIRKKAAGPAPRFSPWWYFGGALVAASLAAVITIRVLDAPPAADSVANLEQSLPAPLEDDQSIGDEVDQADTAVAENESAKVPPETQEDELADAESVAKMAAVTPPPAEEAHGMTGAGRIGGLAKQKGYGAQAKSESESESESLPMAAESVYTESVSEPAVEKKSIQPQKVERRKGVALAFKDENGMHTVRVNETKSTISPNLSKPEVMALLKQRLDGDMSCVPETVKLKGIAVIFEIGRDGRFTSVKTEPTLPQSEGITECFKTKFQGRETTLTPSDKGPARAKIQIELQ